MERGAGEPGVSSGGVAEQRPHVTLHFAQSIDGRIAARSGKSGWISGRSATRFAHELRAAADAVIVGSGTALADDPLLTVRHVAPRAPGEQPMRVVLDGRSRLPSSAKLVTDRSARTVHATCAAAPSRLPGHVERWELPAGACGGVDIHALLAELGARGARSVLVEGGHSVITSFLGASCVDRLIVAIAPIVLGTGIDAVGDLGIQTLENARRFQTQRVWRLDDDVLVELLRPASEKAP